MRNYKWRNFFIGFLVCSNIFVWHAVATLEKGNIVTVAILDVGQGDGIYIKAPGGNEVLIDGGPSKKILAELGELMPFWDRSIDLLILSHPHTDHINGLVEVLKRFQVAGVLESAPAYSNPSYPEWYREIGLDKIPALVAKRGEVVELAPGVTLEILSPNKNYVSEYLSNVHESMVVARLVYASTSILFTGDMEEELERELIVSGVDLRADVLKIGHHGSKTSTSEEFLRAVQPKLAVISVGKGNTYGHPTREVLDRLARHNIPVLRTDEKGTILLKSDGQIIKVQ